MTVRTRERRSALASWSARFSIVSIPVLVIAAIGHRVGLMDALSAYATIALGFVLAALGIIAAIAAFESIWRDGRKGLGAALRGLIIGSAVLSIPAIGAWKVLTLPPLVDISTDLEDPPDFTLTRDDPEFAERAAGIATDDAIALQQEEYPDILPRRYPVGAVRVFDDASDIVASRGWTVLGTRRPDEAGEGGWIEAVALTPIFGFRQDVVIRITPDGEGTLVDMRSMARNGEHDLGANAERIRSFFTDLDTSLQGISEE